MTPRSASWHLNAPHKGMECGQTDGHTLARRPCGAWQLLPGWGRCPPGWDTGLRPWASAWCSWASAARCWPGCPRQKAQGLRARPMPARARTRPTASRKPRPCGSHTCRRRKHRCGKPPTSCSPVSPTSWSSWTRSWPADLRRTSRKPLAPRCSRAVKPISMV